MPPGASYFCSVPWLHPQPITFASCHTLGHALCHTEIQKGDCEEISSDPLPLRRNQAKGMHSLERSVATTEWMKTSMVWSWLGRALELAAVLGVWCPGRTGYRQPSHICWTWSNSKALTVANAQPTEFKMDSGALQPLTLSRSLLLLTPCIFDCSNIT